MATTTTTVSGQQTIPEVLEPYFTGAEGIPGLLPTAQGVFARDYATVFQPLQEAGLLGAGRVAGLSPTQTAIGQQLAGMTTPGQFGAAGQFAGQAGAGLQALQGAQALTVGAPELTTYQMAPTATVAAQPLTAYQMQTPETFGLQQAQQYMSPYAQSVTDVSKRMAIEDARRAQLASNLSAGRRGTLGASSNLLATTERERALGTQLGDIQARGLEAAYQSAQQQFERDRAARQQAASQNLQAQLGVQQLGAQQGLQAQQLNQAALQEAARQNLQAALGVQQLGAGQSLQAQQANQQAALQAAQQRLAASQGLGALAGTAGQLGVAQQAADIDRMKVLGAYGDLERAYAQQQLDARYQEVLRQMGFPESQLSGMANILRGVPLSETMYTSAQTTPPPSFASQLSGLGLSGLSLYNLLGKAG